MMSPPARIPVCLVTGAASADKQSFLHTLLAARPADERWAVLDNDGGDLTVNAVPRQLSVAAVNGCACCTGQVALQTGIAQLARQARPHLLIIAAAGAAEPAPLQRALQQEDLARGIRVSHRLCVVTPELLGILPPPVLELLQRQMTAADYVIAVNAAAAATLRASGIGGVIQMEDAIRLVIAC